MKSNKLVGIFGDTSYDKKIRRIFGNSLIGYWPLDEKSGTVAYDRSGNLRNGAHTGVTLLNPGAELLTNGGFEVTGAGGADVFGTWNETVNVGTSVVERTTTEGEFHGGQSALKITRGDAIVEAFQTIAAIPGATYTLRLWMKGRTRLKVLGTGSLNVLAVASYNTAEFEEYEFTIQNPTGNATLAVYCIDGGAAGESGYFDDVSVVATSPNGIRGLTAPYFDGTNDFVNIYSAALAAAFNGAEGTLLTWARVSGAGVWTDGMFRNIITIDADASNYLRFYRSSVNNVISLYYKAATVAESISVTGLPDNGWMQLGLTWNKAADEVKGYKNGAQIGTTQTTLGEWAGAPAATTTVIGAATTAPTGVWSGLIGPTALLNYAATPAQIKAAYDAALPLPA